MRKVALTSAAAALVLGLAGVVAIAAASQAAEPSTAKSKTLTFDVVFSPFTLAATNNERVPNSPFALGDEVVFHDQLFSNGKHAGLRRSRSCTMLPGWVVGGGIGQPTGAAGVGVIWQTCWVVSSWVVTGPSRIMLASDGRGR